MILNNEFTHWGTITYDPKKINRYDLDLIQRKTSQALKDIRKRVDPNIQYLLVFEQHKDKAWHGHMFLNTQNSAFDVAKNKKGNPLVKNGHTILNWKIWAQKFGFTEFVSIEHLYRSTNESMSELLSVANYITKYITKELAELRANKKKYWHSRGLTKPVKSHEYLTKTNIPKDDLIVKTEYDILHKIDGQVMNKLITSVYHNYPF